MSDAGESVAIVGIGCRLPGGVDGPAGLWELLRDGRDAITPIPPERFDAEALHADGVHPGRIATRWGGFVDAVDRFDAPFFELAPRQAELLDPQHRLLLETTWQSMEDAGLQREVIAGTNAGVYVGLWLNEYETRVFADRDRIDFHATIGTGRYAAAGRLSYFLDLLGPSLTIDTACSSSLAAIHLACQGLRDGSCDLAFAGGANVIVEPFITIAYSQSQMMAPDGRCKFGDAAGNGYVRSDGAVMLALRRTADALAAGNRIYAVVRGSAVTNDGRTSGLLSRPGVAGQEHLLRRAYAAAGVDPSTVQYVEAHGTGTVAGDPVELSALGAVVGAGSGRIGDCLVGSIKTNIGHTEGAAGAAGLAKVALALHHGEVPASLHFDHPNPDVAWGDVGVRVATEHQPWPRTAGPRRAGVSAFGIAGTNAHVVVEQAPDVTAPDVAAPELRNRSVDGAFLLPIAATGVAAVRELAQRYADLLDGAAVDEVAEVCAAAATQRSHLADRIAVVGVDASALAGELRERARGDREPGEPARVDRVVFVFPGQGAQWRGMGRDLLATEPAFAAAMAECDAAIRAEAGWSPIEVLAAPGDVPGDRFDLIAVVQPLLFAVQVSLTALWRAWGVRPHAVVGHSMGEVAAAHAAGALDLADATAVICRRSALLRRISGQGAMAVVDLPADDVEAAIAPHAASLSVAVSNSARSTVVAGDPDVLDDLLARLQEQGVFCRKVNVDVASHSPQVDPLLGELRAALADIAPRPATTVFRSTVTGEALVGDELTGAYWAANLRRPVRFGDAIRELASAAPTAFVEISPHPLLAAPIDDTVRPVAGVVLASMHRDRVARTSMLEAAAALYERGIDLDWAAMTGAARRHVDLPGYPWQRERHWLAATPGRAGHGAGPLDHRVDLADEPGAAVWQTSVGEVIGSLGDDHVVGGSAVVPAAAWIGLARSMIAEPGGTSPRPVHLGAIRLHELVPVGDVRSELQLTVAAGQHRRWRVHVRRPGSDGDATNPWALVADGEAGPGATAPLPPFDLRAVRDRCTARRTGTDHRRIQDARSLTYGPAFATVAEAWVGDGEALVRVEAVDAVDAAADHLRAVTMLDGCLQAVLAALPARLDGVPLVPVAIDRGVLPADLDRSVAWCHARVTELDGDQVEADLVLAGVDDRCVGELAGVRFRCVGGAARRVAPLLHELAWVERDRAGGAAVPSRWLVYGAGPRAAAVAAALMAEGHPVVVAAPEGASAPPGTIALDPTSARGHREAIASCGMGGLGVVYAWQLDASGPDGTGHTDAWQETIGVVAPTLVAQAALAVDAAVPPRLFLLTTAADTDAIGALVRGFGRSLMSEEPSLRCTLVDVGDGLPDEASAIAAELLSGGTDQQISVAAAGRRVARLVRRASPSPAPRTAPTTEYRLAALEPGVLERLGAVAVASRACRPGEVTVRPGAVGINFLDVLKALGMYDWLPSGPDVALGAECTGVVTDVGEGVEGLDVGDRVVATTPSYHACALLGSVVTVPACFVAKAPEHLDPVVLAAQPVAYMTALLGLRDLARVGPGDVVLVHSAAGGVGMAAIDVCHRAGASVIATAGTPEKRALVHELGVAHVFDSRDAAAFSEGVRQVTDGRGVDVVLNSLTGDSLAAGIALLAPRGRFVEIGKRDVYGGTRVELASLRSNQSLHVVDLAALVEEAPADVAALFAEVVGLVGAGRLTPLPVEAAPIEHAPAVFRSMASGEHTGKLVLTVADAPQPARTPDLRPDGTYLVTGGLGALGLVLAEHLVAVGARHLVLVGRSAPGPEVAGRVERMRRPGVRIEVATADVSIRADVSALLDHVRATMPAIRGVFHLAGVLADATVRTNDPKRAVAAVRPKLRGAQLLDELLGDDPLEQFVVFSSVAGVLGLAGQSSYAAGNAAADAVVRRRHAAGRPGTTIQWGPWSDVGLAAASAHRGDRLAARGLGGIDNATAMEVLDAVLASGVVEVAVMPFDVDAWVRSDPGTGDLVADLHIPARDPAAVESLTERLSQLAAGAPRRRASEEAVVAELATVLRVGRGAIRRDQAFQSLGLDSLLALELRNRLERATGLTLPASLVWNHPTVAALARELAARLGVPADADADTGRPAATAEPVGAGVGEARVADGVDDLDDLDALLADELAAVERLLENDR